MNPLRIHLQLIGMVILWGASWPWGLVIAQAMPTLVASSMRFFFAIIPLIIWLYAANRFKYAKQLKALLLSSNSTIYTKPPKITFISNPRMAKQGIGRESSQ